MNKMQYSVAAPAQNAMATNKVIKNTFALLSMTLIFSSRGLFRPNISDSQNS